MLGHADVGGVLFGPYERPSSNTRLTGYAHSDPSPVQTKDISCSDSQIFHIRESGSKCLRIRFLIHAWRQCSGQRIRSAAILRVEETQQYDTGQEERRPAVHVSYYRDIRIVSYICSFYPCVVASASLGPDGESRVYIIHEEASSNLWPWGVSISGAEIWKSHFVMLILASWEGGE